MSRSYKKTPICTDNGNSGYSKRIANRIARRKMKSRCIKLPKGNKYKHLYCSYDICDYKFDDTLEETIRDFLTENPEGFTIRKNKIWTVEDEINKWKKYYLRK